MSQDTLADVGEIRALERILPLLPVGEGVLVGPGDDCAVIAVPDARQVVTTDTMFQGADFLLEWSTFEDLGRKAVATNLSDIASMGARPTAITLALGVPSFVRLTELQAFATGVREALAALAPGCGVIGGDLATSEQMTIAVTAFGSLDGRAPVLRSGASDGDTVVVAGALGLAGAGLALLFAEAHDGHAPDAAAARALRRRQQRLIDAQLRPTSPIAAGPKLAEAGATAMLDVSDGLALDASRIARASGVSVDFSQRALDAIAAEGGVSVDAVLHGGEDHALLATLPPDAALPDGVRAIGVVRAAGESAVTVDGAAIDSSGWDPFRR